MNSDLFLIFRDFIVTGFQIWCLTLLFVNEKRKNRRGLKLLFWAIITGIVVLMSYLNFLIPIKLMILVALIVLLGRYVYNCSSSKLLLYGIVFVLIEYCSELIVIQFWNYFNKPIYSQNIMYDDFSFMLIVMINMVCFILTSILGKIIKQNETKVKLKDIYPIIIQGLPFIAVLLGIHLALPTLQAENIKMWFLIGSIGVCIAFIFNVMYMQNYLKMLNKAKEEEEKLNELKMKNEYYLQKMEVEERIKSIYHDLKNYFILSDQEMIGEEIRKKLDLYERFYETGNEFLNIILAEKISKAYEKGINIECHVDFSKGDFIDVLDISTIFGNLLDNALEAVEKVQGEERYIFLNVATKRNLLIIVIKNSMVVNNKKNISAGKKWNATFHGYGLKNIEKSLDNYDGKMKINVKEGEFEVDIVLPIPV